MEPRRPVQQAYNRQIVSREDTNKSTPVIWQNAGGPFFS